MKNVCRLFIIDDEGILRNGLKYLCNWEDHGFTIVGEASNGSEALVMLSETNPHIIITDIVMPVMDGIELAKVVKKQYPHIKIIVLSSFSEFNYVREAFKYGISDYLLKPKLTSTELLNLLQKIRLDIDETTPISSVGLKDSHLLKELFNPFTTERDTYMNQLIQSMPKEGYYLLKLNTASFTTANSLNSFNLEQSLKNTFTTYLKEYIWTYTLLNNEYLLLINLDYEKRQNFLSTFHHLLEKEDDFFHQSTFIISSFLTHLEDILPIHPLLTQKLGRAFYFEQIKLVEASQILLVSEKNDFDFNLLTSKVNGLDFEQVKYILTQFFEDVRMNQYFDEYSFKRLCQNIIYNLINSINNLGFNVADLQQFKMRIFKSIDLAIHFNDIIAIVYGVLSSLSDIINTQPDYKNTIILNKIIQYVEKHYTEEITLSDIAANLHLNYYYLSAYFKHQTSENLTAYINKVRVEKAKELLIHQELSIAEVSLLVGFSEHNYFSKVFKKYTQMTPSTYRRKMTGWSLC